jgi:hypothetical protein
VPANYNIRTNDATKVPAMPSLPASVGPEMRKYLQTLEQILDIRLGRRGDPRDRAVTLRELISSGLAQELAASPYNPNAGSTGFVQGGARLQDLAIPPAPTGFVANGAFSQVNLNWNYPAYSNHSHTEVHSHTSDVIGDAVLIGIQTGRVFIDPVGSGQTRYYWVRHVNTDNITGPFNSASGTAATTATDVNHMLGVLTGAITTNELAQDLSGPIGNLPANTQAAIDLKKANIPTFSMTSFALGDIAKESGTGTKLYIAIQAVPSNGRALTNTSFWKLYGDYASLKSASDTAASDITAINTITSSSNSAAAVKLAAVDAILFDSSGNEIVSASNLSTMSSTVLNTNGTARATATQFDQLAASYTNPTTGVANNVTLQQALETSASEVDGLRGQYSVKLDTNGAVAGFGLSSTGTGSGNITSEFIVNADRFAIMRGGSNTAAATVPFVVQASATTLNGESVPAGVYMADAFIKNGSIQSAKIGNLSADKINAGFLSAARINTNTIDASKLVLDNSTIESQNINGVPTVIIKDLGVGEAKIGNLQVSTLKIQDQAVTFPNAITTSANVAIASSSNNTTFATIQTLTGTYSGAPVLISGSFAVRSHDDQALMRFRLRRGSTVLFTSSSKAVRPTPDLFIIPFNFLDTSTSTGSRTYTLQAYVQDQFGNYSDRSISTLEVKK